MLRDVVKNFLETLTERDFDAPLLALLAAQGFTDVHFIHGSFEFGKDAIAKRLDEDGLTLRQYSIQSKAGDLGLSEWRAVRPQLEECEYNTLAHPSFDAALPRVAVLVTTGVLKGAASTEAQAFRNACRSRGLADFTVWDRETILEWLCQDPTLGLSSRGDSADLLDLLSSIARTDINEPRLERFSRAWIDRLGDDSRSCGTAMIEAAIIVRELTDTHRLDLAAYTALHLYRATWTPASQDHEPALRRSRDAAVRLFVSVSTQLLTQFEPILGDPLSLAGQTMDLGYVFTYPALCSRVLEVLSLLCLVAADGHIRERASTAVLALAREHDGAARPPSDQFAVGVLPAVVVLATADRVTARSYLRRVSQWMLDSYDQGKSGLGLGGIDESESVQFERIAGGRTTLTTLECRRSSYLVCVVLDALWVLGEGDLYDAVRQNAFAVEIVPSAVRAREEHSRWRRGGKSVYPQPRVDYPEWSERADAEQHNIQEALDSILLAAVARNRHDPGAYKVLLDQQRDQSQLGLSGR
ncbi:MAG: hypothetical protein QME72_01940 [Rhodococcus sp. (in: high G+C Gram-positive bacteria)]|nr:hypothetical protein [Rhodococcus sp. (in: high G+C Gram-positive bacteria)]MDI6626464.1 hypothetical protein [Rhodococcus sp. (in: high G+C Gram-positive bacteria)]